MMPLFLIISFTCTRGGPMQSESTNDEDRRAIEELNDHDVKATLAGDVDAIVSQWTEDFTVLPPAGPIIRGAPQTPPPRSRERRSCRRSSLLITTWISKRSH